LHDETICLETLKNGLQLAILPKKGFKKIHVSLDINFGGIDTHYQINGVEKKIPAGVAHFLEHMLFSNSGNNLAEVFSQYGAEINAYTSKSITSYKFECIHDLDYLLAFFLNNFVTPDFSIESVSKERDIIAHELNMSNDSYHHQIHSKLKRMMYSDDSIYEDVGGRIKDIKAINNDILKDVFYTFYHPKNSKLIITGDVDPIHVIELLENISYMNHSWGNYSFIKRLFKDEPRKIHHYKKYLSNYHTNMISIGIKIPQIIFEQFDREFIHISIGAIINNAFGLASANFDTLKKLNLMNASFSTNSIIEKDYGFINVYMQTDKADQYFKLIMKMLQDIYEKPLDNDLFLLDRKSILGNFITLFDSLSRAHDFVSTCLMEHIDMEHYLDKILHFELSDLEPMKQLFVPENIFTVRYLKTIK
jgi:predicted Zn-dependent peptidase